MARLLAIVRSGVVGFIDWLDGVVRTSKSLSNDQTVGESSYAKRNAGCGDEKTNWGRSVRCDTQPFQHNATKTEREEHKDQPCPGRASDVQHDEG